MTTLVLPPHLRRPAATAILLVAAAGPALAQISVQITSRETSVQEGGRLPVAAQVTGGRTNEVAWKLQDGPGELVQDDRGGWAYLPGDRAAGVLAHLRAYSLEDPREWERLEVRILHRVLPKALDLGGIKGLLGEYGAPTDQEGDVLPGVPSSAMLAMPFLDPATGRRFDRPAAEAVVEGDIGRLDNSRESLIENFNPEFAYGLPASLHLGFLGWHPAAPTLLTYQEGDEWVRRDITGLSIVELTCRGRLGTVVVERLERQPGGDHWQSHILEGRLRIVGMVPLAGGLALGMERPGEIHQGLAARFREPWGVVPVDRGFGRRYPSDPSDAPGDPCWVVADHASHAISCVFGNARVGILAGNPGHPGYEEGIGTMARFRSPTFLAVQGPHRKTILVADTGNSVIRSLDEHAQTRLVAGTPGQPGYRNTSRQHPQALFDHPQGIAVDSRGCIYVADTGNKVIRLINPHGQVRTLAGRPQEAGTEDGVGAAARFTDPRGLALDEPRHRLYILDGHSLRSLAIHAPGEPGGMVETVLGDPVRPGFLDVGREDGPPDPVPPRTPCFNDPCGITLDPNPDHPALRKLYITDRGNRAVRTYSPHFQLLRTLIGEPPRPVPMAAPGSAFAAAAPSPGPAAAAPGPGPAAAPEPGGEEPGPQIRWGLLRHSDLFPGDQRFALTESPRCVALSDDPRVRCLSQAHCLALLGEGSGHIPSESEAWSIPELVKAEIPFRITLNLRLRSYLWTSLPAECSYSVALVEPDGTVSRPKELQGLKARTVLLPVPDPGRALDCRGTLTLTAEATLDTAGPCQVVFSVLSDRGGMRSFQQAVAVQ